MEPASQRIISEDDWNYKIEPGKEPTDTAAITRTNSNRQSEYWFYDTIRGQETTISDGITTVLQMFTSGYLANRSRSFHSTKGGKILRSENGLMMKMGAYIGML